jgi:hypothetical protein
MNDRYSVGAQPCDSYLHRPTLPFRPDPICGKNGCDAHIQFCECCSEHHHEGGFDNCPTIKTTLQPEPRSGLETSWED